MTTELTAPTTRTGLSGKNKVGLVLAALLGARRPRRRSPGRSPARASRGRRSASSSRPPSSASITLVAVV